MITSQQLIDAKAKTFLAIKDASIMINCNELDNIEIVDFGLNDLYSEGVQVFTMVSTDRVAANVLVLFPNQTEPEHWHQKVDDDDGKQEIVRVIKGIVRFYITGKNNMKEGFIPKGKEKFYTCRSEIIMKPGDQIVLEPMTKHWFQTDENGAVMYSFSSCVRDALDGFTDTNIK